ncbi:MAG: inositol monophosphatase [Gammaproteobacteria bacterium]|nr:inositol monophosphatase [Gammaproteobacteria bacterium]
MHPLLNTAIKAARRAGSIIQRYANQLERLTVESKGRNDFVTEVDRTAEQEIIAIIRSTYPDHAILAEESGEAGVSDYQWIIDPLDGTTNFLHGYPQYSVSIGIKRKDKLDQAVVFDPVRNELFTASRGNGAHLNDRRIRVSKVSKFDMALIGTGFPFKSHENLEIWIKSFREIIIRSSGVRRAGSAALDLAHVACGRLDGFWEIGLNPWDMAAGCLLIEEAGGLVSEMSGDINFLETGNVLAGNPKVHEIMLSLIKPQLPTDWENRK